jgi:hypothetical protein
LIKDLIGLLKRQTKTNQADDPDNPIGGSFMTSDL